LGHKLFGKQKQRNIDRLSDAEPTELHSHRELSRDFGGKKILDDEIALVELGSKSYNVVVVNGDEGRDVWKLQ
jgi:hypothetical protein